MDKRFLKLIMAFVIIIAVNVGIFILGNSEAESFWVSYTYAMIAALITVYIEIFFVRKEELIFRYPISVVTYLYLIVELIVAVVAVNVFSHFAVISFMVQLAILVLYIVGFLSVILHNTTTKEQQEIRGTDIVNYRYITDMMKALMSKVAYSAPYKKKIDHAYDAIINGQVKSDISVYEQEQQMIAQINIMSQAVDNNDEMKIVECCDKIETLAGERSRRLGQRLPF